MLREPKQALRESRRNDNLGGAALASGAESASLVATARQRTVGMTKVTKKKKPASKDGTAEGHPSTVIEMKTCSA